MINLPDSPRATEEMIKELLHGEGLPDFVGGLSSPPGESIDRGPCIQAAPAMSLHVDFQPRAEGTIDPAHSPPVEEAEEVTRPPWKLRKSVHLCPPEPEPEPEPKPELIPGMQLNPFDGDWGPLVRLPCGTLSLLPWGSPST
ncbi:unnamed protein product [Spirodela intermedia]|uniref:Uncharacterized protein n=1 Tax=Spirodela intermedia TaxID=51605 RepID=A0A7I8JEZ1_SPIIN|nr:unnamed protein product [Spirodela intermedia]CAA6667972.1 unnamed protein product [Spirodela intermedia]